MDSQFKIEPMNPSFYGPIRRPMREFLDHQNPFYIPPHRSNIIYRPCNNISTKFQQENRMYVNNMYGLRQRWTNMPYNHEPLPGISSFYEHKNLQFSTGFNHNPGSYVRTYQVPHYNGYRYQVMDYAAQNSTYHLCNPPQFLPNMSRYGLQHRYITPSQPFGVSQQDSQISKKMNGCMKTEVKEERDIVAHQSSAANVNIHQYPTQTTPKKKKTVKIARRKYKKLPKSTKVVKMKSLKFKHSENPLYFSDALKLPDDSRLPPTSKLTARQIASFLVSNNKKCNALFSNVDNLWDFLPKTCGGSLSRNHKSVKEEDSNSMIKFTDRDDVNSYLQRCSSPTANIPLWNGLNESGQSVFQRLAKNLEQAKCQCDCLVGKNITENDGPYYTHLAAAPTVDDLRKIIESRTGEYGVAVRIERLIFTSKEGKTDQGCPIAKWVIRRRDPQEKVLCLVRPRIGHSCSTAVLCVAMVVWDGVEKSQADDLYSYLIKLLPEYGNATNRRCELNEERTCACQGIDPSISGASFSFGCSWSMYYDSCKFTRSVHAKKFKLKNMEDDELLADKCHTLADNVALVYKRVVPAAYRNQTFTGERAQSCRLGYRCGGPFSGITACVDFCAHAHKDVHNMNNGCTVVVTLTKHRGFYKPDDEQLHVLPNYLLDLSDRNPYDREVPGLEILTRYPMHTFTRKEKAESCKKRTLKLKAYLQMQKRARLDKSCSDPNEKFMSSETTSSEIQEDTKPEFYYSYNENQRAFSDPEIGGVAVALSHGSILFECAKKENHATTALNRPDRRDPKRISLVFYQHKLLNEPNHGAEKWRQRRMTKENILTKKISKRITSPLNFVWPKIDPPRTSEACSGSMENRRVSTITIFRMLNGNDPEETVNHLLCGEIFGALA
uniref:Methylcytosine dioxygenase TET n=1 Tax=Romanomermis culicivorax TaxID=13658 RepID=A0A915JRU8_ROMCU